MEAINYCLILLCSADIVDFTGPLGQTGAYSICQNRVPLKPAMEHEGNCFYFIVPLELAQAN